MNRLDIVGFGPGDKEHMTFEAFEAISKADIVVGFSTYVNLLKLNFPDKQYFENGMGGEVERTKKALELANEGKRVALVCSGDSSVYGMAGLAYELSVDFPMVEITTVAGLTAALSGSALLGAACGNDLCLISLSDYHTSWPDIENRLKCAASCDFVIALYNPCSKKRPDSLKKACKILLEIIPENRVCGVARNIGRADCSTRVMSLKELETFEGDMFTTVFIGNSKTLLIKDRMVTPRGYNIG